MNDWRFRGVFGILIWVTMQLHSMMTESLPNTDAGMLIFHGSAALVDFILLYSAPSFMVGQLCDDIQRLCLASIVVNFLGWLAYTAYAPPLIYNTVMWGLSYAQWGRLLIVDDDNATDNLGVHLVHRDYLWRV